MMDRNLALEAVRVTEAAAIAAARFMGRGDNEGADRAAVEAMRRAFNDLAIDGEVVIGEGERDEAPMLYIGERVGRCADGDADVEIAVETSLAELKRASVRFGYRILRGDDLLATGETVHACVDLEGRIRRLPAELLALLGGEPAAKGA